LRGNKMKIWGLRDVEGNGDGNAIRGEKLQVGKNKEGSMG